MRVKEMSLSVEKGRCGLATKSRTVFLSANAAIY